MCTVTLPHFDGEFAAFREWSRILRNSKDEIVGLVEAKDATEEQLQLKDVNPSFFCFDPVWLWENIHSIDTNNAKAEFYLTDLVNIAIAQQRVIPWISVDPHEAMGANTLEEITFIEQLRKA